MIRNEVEKRAASIDFLMCGHTHMPVSERDICGIPCLNVGADYGIFRGVIYDTLAKSIRWVGEPVSEGREACPASHNSKKLGEKAERTPQSPWWERLSTVQEPYPHIPEKQILYAMPESLHSRWDQFMGGQGVLALDDGDSGIYPSDFDRFLRSLGDSSTPREPEA